MSTSTERIFYEHDRSLAGWILWNDAQDTAYQSVYPTEDAAWQCRHDPSWQDDPCSGRLCTLQPVLVEYGGGWYKGGYCMTHHYLAEGWNPNHCDHVPWENA